MSEYHLAFWKCWKPISPGFPFAFLSSMLTLYVRGLLRSGLTYSIDDKMMRPTDMPIPPFLRHNLNHTSHSITYAVDAVYQPQRLTYLKCTRIPLTAGPGTVRRKTVLTIPGISTIMWGFSEVVLGDRLQRVSSARHSLTGSAQLNEQTNTSIHQQWHTALAITLTLRNQGISRYQLNHRIQELGALNWNKTTIS